MRVSARCDRCQCRTAACFFHLPRHHFGVHPFLTCIPSVRRHTLRVALIVPFSEKSTSINQLLCFRDFLCLLAAISPQWIPSILAPDLLTPPSSSLLFPLFFFAHLVPLSSALSYLLSPLLLCLLHCSFVSLFFLSLFFFSPPSLSQEPVWLQCDLFSSTAAAADWHGWELALWYTHQRGSHDGPCQQKTHQAHTVIAAQW